MVKKLLMLSVATLAALLPPSVSAEQAAADKYRRIIESGNFFIEYHAEVDTQKTSNKRDKFMNKLTVQMIAPGRKLSYNGEDKKVYINKKTGGIRLLDYVKNSNGVANIFMMNVKYLPLASYQNGKYYQFYGKMKRLLATKTNSPLIISIQKKVGIT